MNQDCAIFASCGYRFYFTDNNGFVFSYALAPDGTHLDIKPDPHPDQWVPYIPLPNGYTEPSPPLTLNPPLLVTPEPATFVLMVCAMIFLGTVYKRIKG